MTPDSSDSSRSSNSLNLSRGAAISVTLNPELLAEVDQLVAQLGSNRDRAIASALELWCRQQQKQHLYHLAEIQQQRHDNDETGWLV